MIFFEHGMALFVHSPLWNCRRCGFFARLGGGHRSSPGLLLLTPDVDVTGIVA